MSDIDGHNGTGANDRIQRVVLEPDVSAKTAFRIEALQKLEAPTFDQIFKNEELRREFENLTRKLDAPSS